jgi:hypothetical protein
VYQAYPKIDVTIYIQTFHAVTVLWVLKLLRQRFERIVSSYLSKTFSDDIDILLKGVLSLRYIKGKMVLAIRFWYHCFNIMSYDALVYYLNNTWSHMVSLIYLILCIWEHLKIKYIMYNDQDIYNNAVHPLMCESWHFIHLWTTIA